MISVALVDDQDLVRAGLRAIIEAEPDMRVVGEASDGAAAGALVRDTQADVVLLDVQMPHEDGISALARITLVGPGTRVIMLTMYDLDEYVLGALRAGAAGFLLKTSPPEQLVTAIRETHRGQRSFAPSVLQRLVDAFVTAPEPVDGVPQQLRSLTDRELEVFRAVARGLSNAEISAQLYLSEATVKSYVTRILAKLGLRSRVQAVILAYECGAIDGGRRP